MPGIPRDVVEHSLDIRAGARPVKQPLRRFDEEKRRAIGKEIHKLMAAGFICNALNLGVEFFLLFPHQIRALPFPFPFSPR